MPMLNLPVTGKLRRYLSHDVVPVEMVLRGQRFTQHWRADGTMEWRSRSMRCRREPGSCRATVVHFAHGGRVRSLIKQLAAFDERLK